MNSEEIMQAKKYNVKLYPIYKMLSWDYLFYYAISFMFLTTIKNIDPALIFIAEAAHSLFKSLLQIPIVGIIEKLGKRKSLMIGNAFLAAHIFVIMFCANIYILIFAVSLSAIGFIIKGLSESTFLYDCIPEDENRGKNSTKVDGIRWL